MRSRVPSSKRSLLAIPAALLAAAGLWLAALAGADEQQTVRQGVYGPDTCDSQSQVVDTKITKAPKKKTSKPSAKFEFVGFYCSSPDDEIDQSSFEFSCKLDKAGARSCTSPQKYRGLKKGKHTFTVAAAFAGGGTGGDPTPAKHKWKIVD